MSSACTAIEPPGFRCTFGSTIVGENGAGDADFLPLDQYVETASSSRRLDPARQVALGQFLTPAPVAHFMASMFEAGQLTVRILDAGTGVGSLSAALIAELCSHSLRPHAILLTTYELDPGRIPYLADTPAQC